MDRVRDSQRKEPHGRVCRCGGFLIFIDQTGTVTAAMQVDWVSTCDTGPMVSVQPEVANALAPLPATSGGTVLGVAEELEKLAGLRDKRDHNRFRVSDSEGEVARSIGCGGRFAFSTGDLISPPFAS